MFPTIGAELNKLSPKVQICCGVITLLVLAVIGLLEYNIRHGAAQSQSWPTTSGLVVENKWSDSVGTSFRYDYRIADKKYTGQKIYYDQGQNLNCVVNEKAYRCGATVTVHYNPTDPRDAVLTSVPQIGLPNWGTEIFGYLMGIFLGIGLLYRGFTILPAAKRQGFNYVGW